MPASPEFAHLFLRGLAWDADQAGWAIVDALEVASRGHLADDPRAELGNRD